MDLSCSNAGVDSVFPAVKMEKQEKMCYSKGWHPEGAGEENVL